ncbi:RecX family transcriptional regulator [Eubacteriaceae bacterium ES3]|nr:RecX family transcriptional regulator [Eubacteriaceae bacterium ES3]
MEKCMEAAVRFLSYRSRTENEVLEHLRKKGFSEEVIVKVMERLREYHYVDDQQYLNSYLSNNEAVKKYGRKRIYYDLEKRGLADHLLQKLDDYFSLEKEKKLCVTLAVKYESTVKGKSVRERQKKLYEKLMRLGYNHQMVLEAVNNLEWLEDQQDKEERFKRLEKDFQKAAEKLKKKGYEGYELKQRLINNLALRGYDYESIQRLLDNER